MSSAVVPCLQGVLNVTQHPLFSSLPFPKQSYFAFFLLSPGPFVVCFSPPVWNSWISLNICSQVMKMHFQRSRPQVGMLQKLIVVILVSLLVVSGQKEETLVFNNTDNQQPIRQEKQQRQRLRHSFDVFFSSKRKVPNASDPLHNRWSAKFYCSLYI